MGISQEQWDKEVKALADKENGKLTKPSEGFFLAKRQMQESLDFRIAEAIRRRDNLHKVGRYADAGIASLEVDFIEKLRDYVRNAMLWDTSKGP